MRWPWVMVRCVVRPLPALLLSADYTQSRCILDRLVIRRHSPRLYAASCGPVYACVCLSLTSQCSIKRDERISLVLGTEASFDQS